MRERHRPHKYFRDRCTVSVRLQYVLRRVRKPRRRISYPLQPNGFGDCVVPVPIVYFGAPQATRGRLPGGDQGTRATLAMMRDLAVEGSKDPIVRQAAIGIVQRSGAREHDPESQLGALFGFVRDRITFIGDVAGVETLQSPRYTLQVAAGDCDDRATLLAGLARSIGIPAELKFRVIAANPGNPGRFTHVYMVARIGGRDIAMDPTYHSNALGYEYRGASRVGNFPL